MSAFRRGRFFGLDKRLNKWSANADARVGALNVAARAWHLRRHAKRCAKFVPRHCFRVPLSHLLCRVYGRAQSRKLLNYYIRQYCSKASNLARAVRRSSVGSTPTLFRQLAISKR